MPSHEVKQIDALTSLRFFAACSVLLFHSGSSWLASTGLAPDFLITFLFNGYLGVSFFFVLSGFILTYVYHSSSMNSSQVQGYAFSRFARVYPSLFLSLVAMIPFIEEIKPSKAIWQFLMLQSWLPPVIPADDYIVNWNLQVWTLSVELFFYLIFPFTLVLIKKLSDRKIFSIVILMALTIGGFRLPEIRAGDNLLFGWMAYVPIPILRTPEFIYGMSLATLFVRGKVASYPRLLFFLVSLLLLGMASSNSPWVASLAGILFGGIILLTPGSLSNGIVSRLISSPLLVLLGKASFGIYIYQLPVRYFIRDFWEPTFHLLARVAYIPTLILISLIILRYYEEPLRKAIKGLISR